MIEYSEEPAKKIEQAAEKLPDQAVLNREEALPQPVFAGHPAQPGQAVHLVQKLDLAVLTDSVELSAQPPKVLSDQPPKVLPEQSPKVLPDQPLKALPSQETSAPAKQPPLDNDTVTAYTASLWKYKPVPEGEPDPAPEYRHHTIEYPASKIIAARVRGKKHKHEGTNCDDWYETANIGRITLIAVSDGAGSKKLSRVGAKVSCKAATAYMAAAFEEVLTVQPELIAHLSLALDDPKFQEACGITAGIVQRAVREAYYAVETAYFARAASLKHSSLLNRAPQLKDLSGTLLLTVLIPIDGAFGEQVVVSCQIGDGMIALINSKGPFEGSTKLMGVPDSGEFSGETDFLTSPQMSQLESLQRRTMVSRCVFDTVMVMTDGVADDYFPNETEMRRLYFDLLANGILEYNSETAAPKLTPADFKILKRIPAPLEYPWVNDPSVKVSLHYTNRICEAMGVTAESLWKDRTPLYLARMELGDKDTDPSVCLQEWLDNYVERGSFDDRTLVVATM